MISKKKLLIINGAQFGYSAGHYYYCKYLRDDFEIEYVCYDRGRKKMYLDNVKVNYIQFNGGLISRVRNFIATSIKISKRFEPDILFVVYFNTSLLLAIFCKGKKKILDIRTGSLADSKIKRFFDNKLITFQSLFFSRCNILSESLRVLLNISKKRTLTLPLGADSFYVGTHDFENINLLYVGTFNSRRIDDTVDGLGLFLKENPGFKASVNYKIIGFGSKPEEKQIVDSIQKNNLALNVEYLGLKNYDELPPYFQNANVGIAYVPITDYYQTQPVTKIFEYGLSGLFTIATATDENKRVITDKNGLLCRDTPESFSEALSDLVKMRSRIDSRQISDTFRDYSWENLVNNQLKPFLNDGLNKPGS